MRVGIGSDHLGFALKEQLHLFLDQWGEHARDFGCYSEEPTDYPDIAFAVAEAVRGGEIDRGILVCGTGIGMAIAANKVPGIFAAPISDLYTARLARERNNIQILTLGANVVGTGLARAILEEWLAAKFRGGESARKVARIVALEREFHRSSDWQALAGGLRC